MQYDKIIRKVLENSDFYKKLPEKAFNSLVDGPAKEINRSIGRIPAEYNGYAENLQKALRESNHSAKNIEKVYNKYQEYANNIMDPKFKYTTQNYKAKYNIEKALEYLDELAQGRSPTKYSDFIDYDFNVAGRKVPVSQFNTGKNPSESFKRVFEDATGKNYDEYIKRKNTPRDTRFDVHRKEDQFTNRGYYEPETPQNEIDKFIDELYFKDRPDLQFNSRGPLDFIDEIGTDLDPELAKFDKDRVDMFTNMIKEFNNSGKDNTDLIRVLNSLSDDEAWNMLHPYDNYLRNLKRQIDIKDDLEAFGKSNLSEIIEDLFK